MINTFETSILAQAILKNQNATSSAHLCLSYGSMSTTLSYLDELEQLQMQLLCLWYYHIGVSRIQTRYEISKVALLWDYYGKSNAKGKLL